MAENIIDNSDIVIYNQNTNVGQYGDCGTDMSNIDSPDAWVEAAEAAAKEAIEAAEKAAEEADRAQQIADGMEGGGVGSGTIVFDTVKDMINSPLLKDPLEKNMRVSTLGYHKKSGIGGASYDIWDKTEYQSYFGSNWEPDGAGDHAIADSNNVAILRTTGQYWAGQLGLEDPLETEEEARRLGVEHHKSLQGAVDYMKTRIDFLHHTNGRGIRHVLVLHIENGNYFMNGTVFIPAGVLLCGGSDWGQVPCVEFKPYKDLLPGENNIENYYPRRSQKVLKNTWEPEFDGTVGKIATAAPYDLGKVYTRGGHYQGFVKLRSFDTDQTMFSNSKDPLTKVWWNADTKTVKASLNVENSDGSFQLVTMESGQIDDVRIQGGLSIGINKVVHLTTPVSGSSIDYVEWKLTVGADIQSVVGDDEKGFVTIDSMFNTGDGLTPMNGSIEYPLLGEDYSLSPSGEEINDGILYWRYSPGTLKSLELPTTDYLYEENQGDDLDGNWYLLGFDGPMWRIRDVYDENDLTGYMFVWNSKTKEYINDDGERVDPRGIEPDESVYLTAYTGGASALTLGNYETNEMEYVPGTMNPSGEGDLDPNWQGNYLRLINGFMTFGSGIFQSIRSDRMSTLIHRPSYFSYGDYYTDRHFIQDIECGIQRENDRFSIDLNGAGDAVTLCNISLPVNHPSKWVPGTFYPIGEYLNGPAKGIKFQTTGFEWPKWKSFIGTSTAGATITRVINGTIKLVGTRNITVTDSHFEFGNVIFEQATGSVNNCYFSQLHGANYPDIDMRGGWYQSSGKTVTINNCEFHRGYDGAHWPDTKYNIIVSPIYNVNITSAQQAWALAGNEAQEIAPTIGYRPEIPKDYKYPDFGDEEGVYPLPGWSRWAPYLRDVRILKGHIVPQETTRTLTGFNGIGDAFVSTVGKQAEGVYWWDREKGEPYPFGTYYYNAQWLLDKGDEVQEALDPDFIPLGKNPSIGGNALQTEKKAVVVPTGNTEEPGIRPVLAVYTAGSNIPEGWIRFYRGTEPGKYSHYVDIPASSINNFEDTGSHMYMRDWKEMPSMVIDPNTGTNMLPLIEVDYQKMYKLDIRGGEFVRWDKPGAAPVTMTGGWEMVQKLGYKEFKKADSGTPVESMVMESIGVWKDKDFPDPTTPDGEGHVYCELPLDGEVIDWDNSRYIIKNGTKTTIVRDTSAGNDKWDLIVSYSISGKQYVLAKLKPGQSVTCVYTSGVWNAVNWGGFEKRKVYSLTEDNMDQWVNLGIPGVEEYIVNFDAPIKNPAGQRPDEFDMWFNVERDAPEGTSVTFVATEKSGFRNPDLISHMLGWNKAILTCDTGEVDQNGEPITDYIGILQFPGDYFTVTKGKEKWTLTNRAPIPEWHHYPDSIDTLGVPVPVDGLTKVITHIFYNMDPQGSAELYVMLDVNQWGLQPVKDGAISRIQLEDSWDDRFSVVIQTRDLAGDVEEWTQRLTKPQDFVEFVWREKDPNNYTNKNGKWLLVDSQIGTPSTDFLKDMKNAYGSASDIVDDFQSVSLASYNGNRYTTVWKKDLSESPWITLPDKTEPAYKDLKIGTRLTFITNMSKDSKPIIVQGKDKRWQNLVPLKGTVTYFFDGNEYIKEAETIIIPAS